jgi:tetratricopeptide (TPR) repeat protein
VGKRKRKSRPSDQASVPPEAGNTGHATGRPRRETILVWLSAGLIVLAAAVVYSSSLSNEFVYDDGSSIADNPSIRSLWPIWPVLSPPSLGQTVGGRPLLNLSFAINYALGGTRPLGYHVTNVAIHALAALLLFGIARRTLLRPKLARDWAGGSPGIALAAALLWTVHPLQTEAVAYTVQRAESLVSLFYLLTLYCVLRGAEEKRGQSPFAGTARDQLPAGARLCTNGGCPPFSGYFGQGGRFGANLWYTAAVVACLAGMASKEIMVTAPLVVLLYDWTFLADSWREIVRRRWSLYLALAATWGLLAYLLVSASVTGQPLDVPRVAAWPYARTQPQVILHYLRLCFWPHPLCLDYEWPVASRAGEIVPPALALLALLAGTVWGLLRKRSWGFLGAWFFLIVAPTSSVVPLGQVAFEHRVYLAMAAVLTLVVAGGYAVLRRLVARGTLTQPAARWLGGGLVVAAAIVLGFFAYERNKDYRDEFTVWWDTLEKAPRNTRAHLNFGCALFAKGDLDGAILHFQKALEVNPNDPDTHNNLGAVLMQRGRVDDAIAQYEQAVNLYPRYLTAHSNLGNALAARGRLGEAIAHWQVAAELAAARGNPTMAKDLRERIQRSRPGLPR